MFLPSLWLQDLYLTDIAVALSPGAPEGRSQELVFRAEEIWILFEQRLGKAARFFDLADVSQAGKLEFSVTRLARAEELPRSTLLQVALCQDEAIVGRRHHLQALIFCFAGIVWDEQAVGFFGPAAHAPAQLV
jgi:hypothetical protein